MSEENENSDREESEEREEKDEKEEKKEKENFSTYEDNLIILLNKLSETIETFNTLSREQAENAILETNSKINNCKDILNKMEEYINNLKAKDEEKNELNKKLLNYKTEYHEILNKFKEIQDNYINKKTENALMDDNLIDEDNNQNDIRMTTGTNETNNIKQKGAGNPYMIDGELEEKKDQKSKINAQKENINKNKTNNLINNGRNKPVNNIAKNEISLISVTNNNMGHFGYNLSPNKEKEEAFHEINQDYDRKKKIIIIICLVACILIFFLIFLIALLS